MKINIIIFLIITSACATWRSVDKDKASLHMQLGISFYQNANYPFALRELLKAKELDDSNPLIHNNLGLVYFSRQKYDLAVNHLTKAIQLEPQFTDAKNNLARVYIEIKKHSEAKSLLLQVLNDLTYSQSEKAYSNLGLNEFQQKNYEESKKYFSKALEYNKESCFNLNYYGRSFFEQAKYESAIPSLDRASLFCESEQFDEPIYYSAIAHYRIGQKDKSISRFKELIKIYPQGKFTEKAQGMINLINKESL